MALQQIVAEVVVVEAVLSGNGQHGSRTVLVLFPGSAEALFPLLVEGRCMPLAGSVYALGASREPKGCNPVAHSVPREPQHFPDSLVAFSLPEKGYGLLAKGVGMTGSGHGYKKSG